MKYGVYHAFVEKLQMAAEHILSFCLTYCLCYVLVWICWSCVFYDWQQLIWGRIAVILLLYNSDGKYKMVNM